MKKLLLILSVLLVSCSTSDDDVTEEITDPIVISNDSWEKAEHHIMDGEDYFQMRITATVANEGTEDKKGIIRFVIEEPNGMGYLNSEEFTIGANSSQEVSRVDNTLLTQAEINKGYDYVEFLER